VAFWAFEGAIFEIFIGLGHANEFHLDRALSTLGHVPQIMTRDGNCAYGCPA